MADAIYAAHIPAYAHGGIFSGKPPFIVIHSTEGPMSDGNARALAQWFARSPAAGGPGTSATDIFDPTEGILMLDHRVIPYHCGPKGNGRGTGGEHCGSVGLTKAQWSSDRAKKMLDRSARANAKDAHDRGWTLAQCRWLTVSEVARFVAGFCTHNDIRLALGGTTHSDPGPNFPYAWYMERVRFWFQNPSGSSEDDLDMYTTAQLLTLMRQAVRAEFVTLGTPTRTQVLELVKRGAGDPAHKDALTTIYGDNRDDKTADPTDMHPENLQRVRQDMESGFKAINDRLDQLVGKSAPDVTPPA